MQIVAALMQLGARATVSIQPRQQDAGDEQDCCAANSICSTWPERLLTRASRLLARSNIAVRLDEAHCVSQWAMIRPEYESFAFCTSVSQVRVLLSPQLLTDHCREMSSAWDWPMRASFVAVFDRPKFSIGGAEETTRAGSCWNFLPAQGTPALFIAVTQEGG